MKRALILVIFVFIYFAPVSVAESFDSGDGDVGEFEYPADVTGDADYPVDKTKELITEYETKPPEVSWSKTYNIGDDFGGSVQETSDGGYIIAGTTSHLQGSGADISLIRTDHEGEELWIKTFDGGDDDWGESVKETNDGGFIIVGTTSSFTISGVKDWDNTDIWLIKTNSKGIELWSKTFDSGYGDWGSSIQETSDGNYIIIGWNGRDPSHTWLIKIDPEGRELWSKTFGWGDDEAASVQETRDGNYIILGKRYRGGFWLITIDSDGGELWSKTFDWGDYYSVDPVHVQETSDKGFIILGITRKSISDTTEDIWLMKTDSEGQELWSKTFGGEDSDECYFVQETIDGGYIILGDTWSYGAGKEDIWLIKTDSEGNKVWDKTFGGSEYDWARSVLVTSDGGYIITGETESFGAGGIDFWLIKVCPVYDDGSNEVPEVSIVDEYSYLAGSDLAGAEASWRRSIDSYPPDGPAIYTLPQTITADVYYTHDFGSPISTGGYKGFKATLEVWNGDYAPEMAAKCEAVETAGYGCFGGCRSNSDGRHLQVHLPEDAKEGWYDARIRLYYSENFPHDCDAGRPVETSGWELADERVISKAFYVAGKTAVQEEWNRTFGGPGWDDTGSVQETRDSGYIIAGYTKSHGAGEEDIWLIKTDSAGNKLWDKTFGGSECDGALFVQETSDGGYIIAGETRSYGAGDYDVWLIKTDSNGYKLWDRTFGGPNYDASRSVQETCDGGYIVAGLTESYGAGDYDVWLIKTDSDGNKLWDRTFGGSEWDMAFSVQQMSDGGYIIAGHTESYGAGNYDVWLIKTDSNGNKLWDRTFGGLGRECAWSMQEIRDGGYIIAGLTESYGAGDEDVWLIKTDSEGNREWDWTFGGAKDDGATSVQETSDGGYIIAGYTKSYGAGGYDVWLVKTDSDGNKLWDRTFGGSGGDEAFSVQETGDGGYIVAGCTESYGSGEEDIWLIKVRPVYETDIDDIPDVSIIEEHSYLAGSDLDGAEATWRRSIDSYPPEGPAIYSLPQTITTDVYYTHDFGSPIVTGGYKGFKATLEVWNGDYAPEMAARCEAVETAGYGCFGGCRSNSDGRHLQVHLPEDAKEGWYDARIRLYYSETFPQDCEAGRPRETPRWNLADERGIANAFYVA